MIIADEEDCYKDDHENHDQDENSEKVQWRKVKCTVEKNQQHIIFHSPDSKGQWIESRQSVTSNPIDEWKTDLVNHTLIKSPPL